MKMIQFVLAAIFICVSCVVPLKSFGEELLVFAGAASKPPTEEIAKAFEKKAGIKVHKIKVCRAIDVLLAIPMTRVYSL